MDIDDATFERLVQACLESNDDQRDYDRASAMAAVEAMLFEEGGDVAAVAARLGVDVLSEPRTWTVCADDLIDLMDAGTGDVTTDDAERMAELLTDAGYPTRIRASSDPEYLAPEIPDTVWSACLAKLDISRRD